MAPARPTTRSPDKRTRFRPCSPGQGRPVRLRPERSTSQSHVGHMVGPVIFDTVQALPDVPGLPGHLGRQHPPTFDDKLIVRAPRTGHPRSKDLAERMTADYLDCLQRLNVTGIDRMPKADRAPRRNDRDDRPAHRQGATPTRPAATSTSTSARTRDYGKTVQNRRPGAARGGLAHRGQRKKRNPGDFRPVEGRQARRAAVGTAPWGPGRPGWHIECSAMSMKYPRPHVRHPRRRGSTFSSPNHENELGPVGILLGPDILPVYWMHNGLMEDGQGQDGPARWATSITRRRRARCACRATSLRFFLIGTHYPLADRPR